MKAEVHSLADARKAKLNMTKQDHIMLEHCDKVPWYVVNRLLIAAGFDSLEKDDMVKRIRHLKSDHKWKPITSLECKELVEA